MKQEVNLAQGAYRAPPPPVSALAMLWVLGGIIAGGAALYGFAAWQMQAVEAQVDVLSGQRVDALARLEGLSLSLPERRESQVLARELAKAEREIETKEQFVAEMGAYRERIEGGFSDFMVGLARQRLEGLWLTRIVVGGGGDVIELRGRSTDPGLVPVLVQRLREEPAFNGTRFASLMIERPEAPPADGAEGVGSVPTVEFALLTRAAARESAR